MLRPPTPVETTTYFSVDPNQTVFALGHRERRITMHSQQIRALNLSAALLESGKVHSSSRVAIIGGGLAGLTCAAALSSARAQITLIERSDTLMGVQLGSHVRYVHPGIFDWPHNPAFSPATALPFLNWRADKADTVAKLILADFKSFADRCDIRKGHKVIEQIRLDEAGVRVASLSHKAPHGTNPTIEFFNVVILAVGFGIERELPGLPVQSYWRDDAWHQTAMADEDMRHLAVVGAGDGGVTDALRLSLHGFDHGTILSDFGRNVTAIDIGRKMASYDEWAALRGAESASFLAEAYSAIRLPDALLDDILSARRTDTAVTLYDTTGFPFQLSSSILNRLLLLGLLQAKQIEFKAGSINPDEYKDYTGIVPRIGPTDALTPLLGPGLALKPRNPSFSTVLSTRPLWQTTSFDRRSNPRQQLRIAVLQNQADRHNRDLVDKIRTGVREHNSRRRGRFLSLFDYRLNNSKAPDKDLVQALERAAGGEPFDVLIVPNSDIAHHVQAFAKSCGKIVVCCEGTTLRRVAFDVQAAKGPGNCFFIAQILDLDFMVKAIKLGYQGRRICYIRSESYPVDVVYFHLLAQNLTDIGDGLGSVEIFEHICADESGFETLPEADIYTGRYFVHAHAPPGFMHSRPFISGYAADMEAGAMAVLDINDAESGQRMVDDILLPLALDAPPPAEMIEVRDMYLGLNLRQAHRFGFPIPAALLSLATNILE